MCAFKEKTLFSRSYWWPQGDVNFEKKMLIYEDELSYSTCDIDIRQVKSTMKERMAVSSRY